MAIIDPNNKFEYKLDRSEATKSYIRGTGNGGQAINKTSSCVQLVHKKSGIVIRCQETRDRNKNEELAWCRLEEKLSDLQREKYEKSIYQNRFNQIGYSDRSDKRRTYRIKDDIVIDHITGKNCSFKDFGRGKIELLC